jgi:adenylosuccinate lyase
MMGALLRFGCALCSTLQVNSEKMIANLEATGGHILSEGIMLALARKIGKQSAHDLVYQVTVPAFEENRSLKSCLVDNGKVMEHLSLDEIDFLLDYKHQLGLCPQFVDRIVELTHISRESDQPYLERYFSE